MAIPSQDSSLDFDFGPVAGEGRYRAGADLKPERMVAVGNGVGGLGVGRPGAGGPGGEIIDLDIFSTSPLPTLDAPPVVSFGAPGVSPPGPASTVGEQSEATIAPSGLWLDGDVLLCSCPDCRAPMTVRLWLMVADCWSCGASIELTEEQEREALRLLGQRGPLPARRAAPKVLAGLAAAEAVAEAAPGSRRSGARSQRPEARSQRAEARGQREVARRRPATRRSEPFHFTRLVRKGLDFAPAWLVSLIVHCILLTLLALFTVKPPQKDGPYITLSTSVERRVREGEEMLPVKVGEVEFDLPIPSQVDFADSQVREALLAADQDARELRIDPDDPAPNLPDLAKVKQQIGSTRGVQRVFAARDPRMRAELVRQEGGTTLTEAAVARGLRWLALVQESDGRWRLHEHGGMLCDSAGTSLALLPFLGAGQTHLAGRYQDTVSQGLRWLVANQRADGDLRAGANNNAGMYAHGQGAIVLCEAYAMTGDEALREPAQKAIDFIVAAQHIGGGWRYQPGMPGDTSVVGWQLMALQSARAGNLRVPMETLENASHFLDTVQSRGGALYSYLPEAAHRPTPSMTAEALLCRIYLGWNKSDEPLGVGVRELLSQHMPTRDYPAIYYWYYGTQTLHHYGGPEWEKWNGAMRDILVGLQETRGRDAGSWPPVGEHADVGGRIYMTSLAVCTLEVYYRHLPIFRRVDVE